jgi:hypothetical protein
MKPSKDDTALARGRAAVRQRAWKAAYRQLAEADRKDALS